MNEMLEARLRRIRETDAFLAVRMEMLLGAAGVITVVGIGLFVWYAIIRGHEIWVIALFSGALGALVGIPIGRFFMPSLIEYIRSLGDRMQATQPHGKNRS